MNNTLLISIDPGDKYVGIFIYAPNKCAFLQLELKPNMLENMSYVMETLDKIREDNKDCTNKILLVENFINYIHKQSITCYNENKTSQMIGYLKQYAVRYNLEYKTQNASEAKYWSNDRLIRLGLIQEKNGRFYLFNKAIPKHTRDAYRHFICYVNKHWFNNRITKEKVYGGNYGK